MSGHWVFGRAFGYWVGTRKNNGNMYESRTVLVDELADARVFNTKGAATRAGNDCGAKGQAVPVVVSLSAPTASPADRQGTDPGKPNPDESAA